MKRRQRRRQYISPIAPYCTFCKKKDDPSYKKTEGLVQFISDRGKILSKERSGLCSKHQRMLAQEIKRARHLALLPFVVKPL